jgi:hypothetical protein
MNRIFVHPPPARIRDLSKEELKITLHATGTLRGRHQEPLAMLSRGPPAQRSNPESKMDGKGKAALIWYHSNYLTQTVLGLSLKVILHCRTPYLVPHPKCCRTVCWVSGESCSKSCAGSSPASPNSDFAASTTRFAVWPCKVSASKACAM